MWYIIGVSIDMETNDLYGVVQVSPFETKDLYGVVQVSPFETNDLYGVVQVSPLWRLHSLLLFIGNPQLDRVD